MSVITRFFRDWPWKLGCLGAATLIWLAVASEPEMTTVMRASVQYKNAPRNLEISSDITADVRLELIGASGRLKSFSALPAPVIFDFSPVRAPGERTFNIDSSTIRLPRGVQLIRAVPAQIRYVFEEQGRRLVPVELQWSGILSEGRQIASVQMNPSALEVIGPEGQVSLVKSVSTDPINLNAVVSGKPVITSPFVDEPQVRFVHFQPIRVTVILKN